MSITKAMRERSKNGKRIYHLHIPRTSGMVICNALYKTFIDNEMLDGTPSHESPAIMYDHEKMIEKPFISGHFAKNPIVCSDGAFEVFSIVRDPVEHYLSIAAYVSVSTGKCMSNEYMDEFLHGYITPFGVNELFSYSGDLQAKSLFCRIGFADKSIVALRDEDVVNDLNIVFVEKDMPTENEIKNQINSMNIFSLQDRAKAVNWLDNKIFQLYGFRIDSSVNNVANCSKMNGFIPDKSHIKEIKKRSEIDDYVYRIVNEKTRDSVLV